MQYKIKSDKGWWMPEGLGYTKDVAKAGRFRWDEMGAFNLDDCTLYRIHRCGDVILPIGVH